MGPAPDINDEFLPELLVNRALDRFGRLDIIVANNAGPKPGGAFDVTAQQILDALTANTLSAIRLVRAAQPILVEQQWGRVSLSPPGRLVSQWTTSSCPTRPAPRCGDGPRPRRKNSPRRG
jgi:NADP-dependent 3-hydroxy acid dehydrogenase YdfG